MNKIVFIKRGLFSHINAHVREQLEKQFPHHELVVLDVVEEILKKKPWIAAANLLHLARMHGPRLLLNRQRVQHYFYQTPFVFHRLRHEIRALLEPHRQHLAFTLQTQSLFDASLPGVPHFVYTDHTHLANLYYPSFDRSTLLPRAWTDLEKEIYQNATVTMTMSGHVQRSLTEHYGIASNRTACVYAGSNTSSTPLPPENDDYRNQNILFVGLDWERKGGPVLVEAFRIVQQYFPDAKLTIVGASPDQVADRNITVQGRLPIEKVKQEYARASIFCLPTRIEPFGIAPLEGFSQKIPAVTTGIGALPDFVQNNKTGLIVPPDDPPALAAALTTLLADPARCRRYGEAGHSLVSNRYNWEAAGRAIKQEVSACLLSGRQERPGASSCPVQPG